MSENPAEGNLQNGEGGLPNPPLPSSTQPLQGDVATALIKRLDQLDAQYRSLQGDKDKRWDKEVMPTIRKLAKYLNVTEEQVVTAQRTAALDELIESKSVRSEVPVAGPTSTQTTVGDVQRVISEYGLDANDPEVLKLLLDKEPAIALGKLAIARAKKNSLPPAPPPPSGETPPTETTKEQLRAKYQKELQNSAGNPRLITEIKQRYSRAGLEDIY